LGDGGGGIDDLRRTTVRARQFKKKLAQGINLESVFYLATMCDCEELEFEDFEVMLATISELSRRRTEEAPLETPIPQLVVAKRKK
jgi:hypothetical protein